MTMMDQQESSKGAARRPIAARKRRWAASASAALIRGGLTPNQVSLLSVAFATLAAVALAWSAELGSAVEGAGTQWPVWRVIALAIAAGGIQLRLLCNLLDGLMAVEGGKGTPTGELFNDLPDRVADAVILIAAGCAARQLEWGLTMGWLAALLAVLTAYVRVLGAASGVGHDFCGPMAKQQRMALLTLACMAAMFEPLWNGQGQSVRAALALIIAGSVITIVRRVAHIAAALHRQIASREPRT